MELRGEAKAQLLQSRLSVGLGALDLIAHRKEGRGSFHDLSHESYLGVISSRMRRSRGTPHNGHMHQIQFRDPASALFLPVDENTQPHENRVPSPFLICAHDLGS